MDRLHLFWLVLFRALKIYRKEELAEKRKIGKRSLLTLEVRNLRRQSNRSRAFEVCRTEARIPFSVPNDWDFFFQKVTNLLNLCFIIWANWNKLKTETLLLVGKTQNFVDLILKNQEKSISTEKDKNGVYKWCPNRSLLNLSRVFIYTYHCCNNLLFQCSCRSTDMSSCYHDKTYRWFVGQ